MKLLYGSRGEIPKGKSVLNVGTSSFHGEKTRFIVTIHVDKGHIEDDTDLLLTHNYLTFYYHKIVFRAIRRLILIM